jgi:hypothetical protein
VEIERENQTLTIMDITDYKNLYRAARKLDEAVDKNSKIYRSIAYKSNYYGFNNTEVNANCMHPFTIQLKSYLVLNKVNEQGEPIKEEWLRFKDDSLVEEFMVKAIDCHKEEILKTTSRLIKQYLEENIDLVKEEMKRLNNIEYFIESCILFKTKTQN